MIETDDRSLFKFGLFGQLITAISIVLIFMAQPEMFSFEGFNFLQSGALLLGAVICAISTFKIIFSPEQKTESKESLDIKDLSESEQLKLLIRTICFSLLAFAIVTMFFYIGVLEIEGKLNFIKDKLPLQKIEVNEVKGTIAFENTNQYSKHYTYLKLQEYPEFLFSYVRGEKLNNEFYHLSNTAIYEPGEKVIIKIRKKDFEKFIINSENIEFGFNLIRFYELTVENQLLLRKKHIIDAK